MNILKISLSLGLWIATLGGTALADSTVVSVPEGYSTIANNYNRGSNTLQDVLPVVAADTVIWKWDVANQTYTYHVFDDIAFVWVPNTSLAPGEGAFIYSAVPQNITFTGTTPASPGPLPRPSTGGKRFLSDRWPFASDFRGITGYQPGHGDRVIFYTGVYADLPYPPTSASTIHVFENGVWMPSIPSLAPWKSAFIDVAPMTLVLSCATNKTVECGSAWTFDSVTATSGGCTNVNLTSVSSTNLGKCSSTYTRVWTATDCANGFGTCTQVVTVVDTTPPMLTCANDKTVQCGSAWNFDPPTAFDSCCTTNPNVYLVGTTVTNLSPCVALHRRAWMAQDCCLNGSFCTQTVTVVDAPVVLCPTNKTVTAGTFWTFDPPILSNTCCANIAVTNLETWTNGWCPQYITHHTRIRDCCTNSFDCYQVVTVVSNCTNCLTIACPNDIRLPCRSLGDTPATWTTNASNSCDPSDLVTWSVPASGAPFDIGITPVTLYASNSLGEVKTCTFSVTIFVPSPRLGGLRIPGPLGITHLALSWARSCHDFGLEAAPLLGGSGPSDSPRPWSPLGGIPTGEWSQPNQTNNALDLFVEANIPLPMPDPADTNVLAHALLRLSDHPVLGVDFSSLPLGVFSNANSSHHGFTFSKPGGGDPEIIDLNNQHVLRIGPEGLEVQCPTNSPRWPSLLTKGPAAYHEIQLTMARTPGNQPMIVTAFDTRNQLIGAISITNMIQTVSVSSLGFPIGRLLFPSTPGHGGGGGFVNIIGGRGIPPICAGPDFRSAPVGPVPNPWTPPGVTLTSTLASGDPDPNTRIEDGPGGHGYHVEYSTEVAFNPCCRYVQIVMVQDSGTGEVVAKDATGAVLGTYVARIHEPLTINLGPFSAPSCRVNITTPTGHARILRLCCSGAAQASCLPTFQIGTYPNPYTTGFASLQVTGGAAGPSATTVLNHSGKVVLDLGRETMVSLNVPCNRALLEVISDGTGGMTLQALDATDNVIETFGPLAASAGLQHAVLAAPGIQRIRISSPTPNGYLYSLCCLPE
jgi:hypothetical protein